MAQELEKLEELFKMGFVPEEEYNRRKADLLAAHPNLSSVSVSSVPALPISSSPFNEVSKSLDLTCEDETSQELIQLNAEFEELRRSNPIIYLISAHPGAPNLKPAPPPPLNQNEYYRLPPHKRPQPVFPSYLRVPKDCLQWLLHKQQFEESEINAVMEACHSYPGDRLHFVFSTVDIRDDLYQTEPYMEGELATYDIVVPVGPTCLEPNATAFFLALNIPTKINKGLVYVMWSFPIVEKGKIIGASEQSLLQKMNIARTYKHDLVFVLENNLFVPARYATLEPDCPLWEAVNNMQALIAATNFPIKEHVPNLVRAGFYDVLGLLAGISDDLVESSLNMQYVNTFTGYFELKIEERKRLFEIAEMEKQLKTEISQIEHDITELKTNIELFELEYKDMKANFEDQDFSFNGMQISVVPHQEKVLIVPKEKKIVPVLVEIKIGQVKILERAPFSLAILLDRSGSMSGDKLVNCKLAIKNIIEKLTDNDFLHFIAYDDKVDLVFWDGQKKDEDKLVSLVERVFERNWTNISEAMDKSVDVFEMSNSTNQNRRAFLFSDGQANAGESGTDALCGRARRMQEEHHIVTSTFGIGSDFKFEVMDGIARAGHGSYFFIDEANNVPRLVDKGLRGLTSLLATDAFLRIKPVEGVRIKKVYGQLNTEPDVPVGDIRFGDLKQTLIDFEIDSERFSVGDHQIATFELVFKSQEQDKATPFLPPSGILNSLSLAFTHDKEAVENQDINYQVEVPRIIKMSAELDASALSAFKSGNITKAIECKRTKMAELDRASLFDRYGFTKVLLQKTRKSLLEFLQDGLRQKQDQYNRAIWDINRKYNQKKETYQSAHIGAAKSAGLFQKQLEYEAMEEECDDMGFGLFD